MKLMKQLKFWSRRKKRGKSLQYQKLHNNDHYYNYYTHLTDNTQPPRLPPPRPLQDSQLCQCHFCQPAEPSAPPLPPWLDLSHETYSGQLGSDEDFEEHWIRTSGEMTDADTMLKSDKYDWTPIWQCREPVISSVGQLGSGEEHCNSIYEEMTEASKLLKSDEYDFTRISECREPIISSVGQLGSGEQHCISISEEITDTSTLLKSDKNDLTLIPGCGEPVKSKRQQGASRNMFGCVIDIGALLLRCFTPCFGFSEHRDFQYSDSSIKGLPNADVGKKLCNSVTQH